jgi:hypothetical protein
LNSDLRAEMAFSEMTPPGLEVAPPGLEVAPDGAADAEVPGVVDTEDGEHAAATRPQAIAATTATMAIAARAGRDPLALRRALPIASLFPCVYSA